jgi:hypothetical protein
MSLASAFLNKLVREDGACGLSYGAELLFSEQARTRVGLAGLSPDTNGTQYIVGSSQWRNCNFCSLNS